MVGKIFKKNPAPEIDSRKAQLPKTIPRRDVTIGDALFAFRQEAHKLPKGNILREQRELGIAGREVEVRLVLDEEAPGAEIAAGGGEDLFALTAEERRGGRDEIVHPEGVREEVRRERLDEDTVVVPEEMQFRVFSYDNVTAAHDLVGEGGDVGVGLSGD